MKLKRVKYYIFVVSAVIFCGCTTAKLDIPELVQLDSMLERRDYYQAMFNERIASLQGLLSETADPIGKYNITIAIADNYQANNYDST
ncbi:MAG: hypothetical protein HUJ92_07865, partial [Bacteroidales bacterium]|nr:hypothetical protein [Bacteroidales bacterium]